VTTSEPSVIHWRISSFSGNNGTCVEVAALPNGHIAVRNSTHPNRAVALSTRAELNHWINSIKAGASSTI
jgi:uncharacterized protein DUF397